MTTIAKSRKTQTTFFAVIITAIVFVILFCVFLHASPPAAHADAAETTYTTTDKLYLELPNHDATFAFEMYADTVNGGNDNHTEDIVIYSSASIKVNDWYEVYIKYDNGNSWRVPKGSDKNGKYYFDPSVMGFNAAVSVYVDIGQMNTGNSGGTLSFIENGDKLYRWTSRTSAAPTLGVSNYISSPGFSVSSQSYKFSDATSWDINNWYVDSYDNIFASGWTVEGPDDFATGYGLNPRQGTFKIANGLSAGQTYNLNIAYTVGVINKAWNLGRCQLAHRSKNAYTYNQTISLNIKRDNSAPEITVSDRYAKNSVSASWTDASYSFATYSYNGTNQGEYTKNTSLRSEGRYIFTATDSVGNSSSETVFVDRTAPKFSSEFYDATGTPVVLKSRTSATANWSNAGTNESPIKSCTYVRQYYDSPTNSIKSDAAKTYTKNTALSAEGKYIFTLEDSAGNSSTATYIVDKTAPVIRTSSEASKTSVSATSTYETVETEITMAYSLNGANFVDYRSGQSLSSEGKYIITAIDEVGNASSVTIYVDKTAPTLTKSADVSKTSVNARWSVGTNESPVTATYTLNGTSKGAYTSRTSLTAEGKYTITATDAAGNSTTVTMYVDRTAPTLTKSAEASKTSVNARWSVGTNESSVTATYTLNGTSRGAYASGTSLTAEGKYTITATDAAGNSTTVTMYVDKTAPVITRSSEYSSAKISVAWSMGANESPITAKYTLTTASGTSAATACSSGAELTAEGKYTVIATDAAGNSASLSFVIDKTAPILTATPSGSQYTRDNISVSWASPTGYEAPISATVRHNDGDAEPYRSGATFSVEGMYVFEATDAAGNSATVTLYIDKTAPTMTFTALGARFDKYTRDPFTVASADNLTGVERLQIYSGGAWINYDFAPRSENGEYLFRAIDYAGNIASATVVVTRIETFGNMEDIRDGYKLNEWYIVTLPARIFTTDSNDVAGRYSFESYNKALAFAVAKEREFRVTSVQGGYMYVSSSNESVAQKYDDDQTLNAAVEKYAKGYISTRQTAADNGNDKFYTELESLTRNSPILPDYMLDYKDLPRIFARPTVQWNLPNVSYLSDMPYTVTAKYLGDFAEDQTQTEFVIPKGSTLITAATEYKQGFYLITERDSAGNTERYVIYSDAELPSARVKATLGDGEREFMLDYAYTQNETLYFLSLVFEGILDNADEYVTMKLEKGSSVKYFTQSDELPVLGSEEYTSGKYTVTVFDRSLNALVFEVYIAGASPAMTHGSLEADKPECKISFVTSDRYNVITGITLYKIEYDGTRTVLETDGAGTPITAATLSYVLTIGGKYGATVTDNYMRTVELSPIFFLKGLPTGRLSGVKDGARTKNNVAITFDSMDVCELFILLPGGERQPFTDYTVQTGSSDKTYNITASELTSHEYLVFLHNANDLSLFVEYTFEIDTILPEFVIIDSDGNMIAPDGATNKAFSLQWEETGVSVRYYTSRSGSLGAAKYNMNAVLSQGTLYYFTIKDDVGNELEFTVLLDNAVDYTLTGNYADIDGVLYANNELTFTVNEPTQVFEIVNSDNYTIDNGGTLTRAGRYDITVTDNYRNTLTLAVVLDFTPPTIELVGAANGESVKNDVAVSAFDYDYLYLTDSRGNKLRDVEDGEVFVEAGSYYITARDKAGNSVTATFYIDLSVDYTLSVPNGAVTTGTVVLESGEVLIVDVKLNGESIESATRFSSPGEYELTLTDEIGNSVSCAFIILPKRMRTLERDMPAGLSILSITRNGIPVELINADKLELEITGVYSVMFDCGGVMYVLELEIDNTPPIVTIEKSGNTVKLASCDKENVTLKLEKDGNEISGRIGQTFEDPGHYVLTVTDELGNVATYEFDIKYRLNTWAIVAIAVGSVVLVVVLVLIIRARRKPRMK